MFPRITDVPCLATRTLLATSVILGLSAPDAGAITAANATTAMNSYNNAFYSETGGLGYYKVSTASTSRDFWKLAEEIEMVEDAYFRTGNLTYKGMVTELCNGFTDYYGANWSSNTFNDDLMWATIAFVRAYNVTGNVNFRNVAATNFNLCYNRAIDTTFGGLWWTTAKQSKNSCVMGPGAIAGYLLSVATGDETYQTKAEGILAYQKLKLYNSSTGAVYDRIVLGGGIDYTALSYNQGTFMGACHFLGDSTNATKAANYAKSWGANLQVFGQGSDLGGFNGICIRWMGKTNFDEPFRKSVANNAWSRRRTPDNLIWNAWNASTPSGTLYSWDCSSAVVAMMMVTPD